MTVQALGFFNSLIDSRKCLEVSACHGKRGSRDHNRGLGAEPQWAQTQRSGVRGQSLLKETESFLSKKWPKVKN